jgi:type II secretory pathway pseudopilin PulG
MIAHRAHTGRRSGITLTEILIAIFILGIGLVSLATLFPIGLLRLRDATRYSRSTYLAQSAAADLSSRGLLTRQSFVFADSLNSIFNNTALFWYQDSNLVQYNPFTQDLPYYGGPFTNATTGVQAGVSATSGPGLPFAYDPLWRFQTINPNNIQANGPAGSPGSIPPPQPAGGYYLSDPNGPNVATSALEARFGDGTGFLSPETDGNGPASAYGLQRLTNFNRPYAVSGGNTYSVMPTSNYVPQAFVSQEDVVTVENLPSNTYSSVLPDLSLASSTYTVGTSTVAFPVSMNDLRYSWMFTGQQTNSSNASCFDGNIVIFENRQFGINPVTGPNGNAGEQVDGETVVEAVFGYSKNINGGGYGLGADKTVLLRWYASVPDPVVKVGDWIADVTYERNYSVVAARWWQGAVNGNGAPVVTGVSNPNNNLEWDNLPAQRCIWYQVQKVQATQSDPDRGANYRSVIVSVNQSLQAKTLLNANGLPLYQNAAVICPSVVNVIPQTIFIR